jgi:hypothetical protein
MVLHLSGLVQCIVVHQIPGIESTKASVDVGVQDTKNTGDSIYHSRIIPLLSQLHAMPPDLNAMTIRSAAISLSDVAGRLAHLQLANLASS